MDMHLKCARANWRPPIRFRWPLMAIGRRRLAVHHHLFLVLSLFHCLVISPIRSPMLMSSATQEQTRRHFSVSQLEDSDGPAPAARGNLGESLPLPPPPPTTVERTRTKPAKSEEQQQLSPLLFEDRESSMTTSSSNAKAIGRERRLKRETRQQETKNKPSGGAGAGNRRQVIHAQLGGQATLGCNLEPSEPDDAVSLVLWYKDKSMVPIYSLDARSGSLWAARHKPGAWLEGRSSLKLVPSASPFSSSADDAAAAAAATDDAAAAAALSSQLQSRARRHATHAAASSSSSERGWRRRKQRRHLAAAAAPEDEQQQQQQENYHRPAAEPLQRAAPARAEDQADRDRRPLWAQLSIDSLSSEDNGAYACRVDFRRARSRTQEMALKIIVPADTPTIRDLTEATQGGGGAGEQQERRREQPGTAHSRVVGPHNEGARVVLECETQGGYPEPSLSWWRDGRLVDDSYEIVSAGDGQMVPGSSRPGLSAAEESTSAQPDDGGQPAAAAISQEAGSSQIGGPRVAAAAATATGRLVRNRLEIGPLTRNDLLANYSCKAPNSKLGEPPTASIMIDMNLRPVKVQIENERQPVLADRPLEIVCKAFGSRPAALMSWFRGGGGGAGPGERLVPQLSSSSPAQSQPPPSPLQQQRLSFAASQIRIEESIGAESNVSQSSLTIWPRPHDSGQIVTCRAENPYMSEAAAAASTDSSQVMLLEQDEQAAAGKAGWLEDSWKLEVHYLPRVELRLGEQLHGQSIREGQDVYFECRVQAAPYAHEIRWWFAGRELESDLPAGIIVSNQSLVLQRVTRNQRGQYTCSAINSVGEAHSAGLHLRVQFAPVCRDSTSTPPPPSNATAADTSGDLFAPSSQLSFKSHYGAARMESVRVVCHVDADPPPSAPDGFKWAFLPAASTLKPHDKQQQQPPPLVYLDRSAFTSGPDTELGPLVSVASYTPRSELDYGTLLCWAQNSLGQQGEPCAYQLIPAEPPEPVRDCRLVNASDSQLVVACEPGHDGGVSQSFQMEVYEVGQRHELVANVTASTGGAGQPAAKLTIDELMASNNISLDGQADQQQADQQPQQRDESPAQAALASGSTAAAAAAATSGGRQPKQRHSLHLSPARRQPAINGAAAAAAAASEQPQRQAPVFITEPNLRPSTNYLLSIYSSNSKGSSKPVAFTASTANQSALGHEATNSLASNSHRTRSSQLQGSDSSGRFALSDVMSLSWSPFLLVCAISVALFVLLGSLTFALIKYADLAALQWTRRRQPPSSWPASSSSPSNQVSYGQQQQQPQSTAATAAEQTLCLSKSDAGSSASNGSSGGSGGPGCGSSSRRARIITLTANGPTTTDTRGGASAASAANQRQHKPAQDLPGAAHNGASGGVRPAAALKQSNSDQFLNQSQQQQPAPSVHLLQQQQQQQATLPPTIRPFSTSSLQRQAGGGARPASLGFQHQQPARGACNYAGELQQPRIEQLLISGKQYFHQRPAGCKSHLLQVTTSQQQPMNHAAGMKLAAAANYQQQQQQQPAGLCMHQQLIDGCSPSERHSLLADTPNCCHLAASAAAAAAAAVSDQLSPTDKMAAIMMSDFSGHHLRLIDAGQFGGGGGAAAAADSDTNSNSNSNNTSLFSCSQTNGSPSSGIAMATSCSTSETTITTNSQQQQQPPPSARFQPYLPPPPPPAATGCGQPIGSNSTLTSCSMDQQQQPQQPPSLFEEAGGNVISVSEPAASEVASGQQQAKITCQFKSDVLLDDASKQQQQYVYSSIQQQQPHICNQYSVYVDHELNQQLQIDANNNNNNNNSPQQIYLLQDEPQQLVKYNPAKARVRVVGGTGTQLDRSACHNYLRLMHPNAAEQLVGEELRSSRCDLDLHTDV